MAAQPRIGCATGLMKVTAARLYIRDNFDEIVATYKQRFSQPVTRGPDFVALMDIFTAQRLPDGQIRIRVRADVDDTWEDGNSITLSQITHCLHDAAQRRLRILAAEKLRELTGRDYRLEHIQGLRTASAQAAWKLYMLPEGNSCQFLWQIYHSIWESVKSLLDAEVLEMARQISQIPPSFADYNLILRDAPAWHSMRLENEALLPFAFRLIRGREVPLTPCAYKDIFNWLVHHGGSRAEWRILYGMDRDCVIYLLRMVDSARETVRLLRHFSAAGIIPDALHLSQYIYLQRLGKRTTPWFDRAAAEEFRQKTQRTNVFAFTSFFHREYVDAVDWLVDYLKTGNLPDKNQRRAGWPWIARMSAGWHEEQVVKHLVRHLEWQCPLESYFDGKFEVLPLLSSEALAREGARMHHCVGGYDRYCHAGRSQIFSIRRDGRSLATVELTLFNGDWRINQQRGPCNGTPGEELRQVAARLLLRFQAAARCQAAPGPENPCRAGDVSLP